MRVLQVLWDGGGNTGPQLAVARELVGRGHDVRVLAHGCQRPRVEATGADFIGYRHAPEGDASSPETDLLRDWEAKTPVGAFARVRDRLMYGPSGLFARDVLNALEDRPAEVVAWDYLLLGAGMGAERAGVPSAAIVHTVYPLPAPGVPPFGQGLMPAHGLAGRIRDRLLGRVFRQAFAPGLRAANRARAELGLAPLGGPFDQLLRADRLLVMTAPELDFAGGAELPAHVLYAGPVVDAAAPGSWQSPWPADDPRPLVLASFSTTFMDQQALAARVVEALGGLDVRALLTTGPAVDPATLPQQANVEVRQAVPHAAVLPEASLVITHAGMGTVHAALAAGVPLVCMPGGRDQGDIAARVAFHGAGVRIRQAAGPDRVRAVVEQALADDSLKRGAQRMAQAFAGHDGAARATDEIEALAARR